MSCLTPILLKDVDTPVPCGKCPECRQRIVDGWAFRLLWQLKDATTATMVTLTYDTRFVPITDKGRMSLNKRDVQAFMKRLRYYDKGLPIKYFAVGEYGGRTWRPHYHVIIFNATQESIYKAWKIDGVEIGNIQFMDVTEASVYYTLKYMCKPGKVPETRNDDRIPEFRIMSKFLGVNFSSPAL